MTQSHDDNADRVRIAFDGRLPHARWGPLFHVFRIEQPEVELEWVPAMFPAAGRPTLAGADVGLFLEPVADPAMSILALDASPMVVIVAAGDPLAHRETIDVSDILDRPFPGAPRVHPDWTAFWTLDALRGGRPPERTGDDVTDAEGGLQVIASGRAIGTLPAWVADGLAHPGVISLPLRGAPKARTCLVWRSGDNRPAVRSLVDLASAWTWVGRVTR
jgi:DNA-binding transcriptional LysR family regulator